MHLISRCPRTTLLAHDRGAVLRVDFVNEKHPGIIEYIRKPTYSSVLVCWRTSIAGACQDVMYIFFQVGISFWAFL